MIAYLHPAAILTGILKAATALVEFFQAFAQPLFFLADSIQDDAPIEISTQNLFNVPSGLCRPSEVANITVLPGTVADHEQAIGIVQGDGIVDAFHGIDKALLCGLRPAP